MPDLLLQLFSEEIPARMQAKAAEDLRRMVTDKLVAEGLVYEGAKAFATPRRLTLTVHGIPARQPDVKEERKGPKVGAPEQALTGLLAARRLDADTARRKVALSTSPGANTPAPLRSRSSPRLCRRSQRLFRGRSRCDGELPRPI